MSFAHFLPLVVLVFRFQLPAQAALAAGCTHSSSSGLIWHTIGEDRFVIFGERLNWDPARQVCRTHGLDVYEPKQIVEVARYILDTVGPGNSHWIGSRGTGQDIQWLSGGRVGQNAPWYRCSEYNDVAMDQCMILSGHAEKINKGVPLGMGPCTGTPRPFLCGCFI